MRVVVIVVILALGIAAGLAFVDVPITGKAVDCSYENVPCVCGAQKCVCGNTTIRSAECLLKQ